MELFPRTPKANSLVAAAIAILLAGLAVSGCGGSSGPGENEIAVVGYSVVGPVYENVLEPAFQKTKQGKGVTFTNSFGPSTDQSHAVAAGQPASIVNFAQEGDMERLVKDDEIVSRLWHGKSQDSAIVMIVRKGNPKGLKSLDDLLTKNIKVIIPNPFSSGAGRWDIMAIYGAQIHEGKSRQEALDAIKAILEKAVAQPRSAAQATTAFLEGKGDVLLSYESEAINLKREGKADYIVPPRTILTEAPIAVTKGSSPAAKAFLYFIWSVKGQELLADHGYRPLNTTLAIGLTFPTPVDFYAITDFGGWKKINQEFFDEQTGSIAKTEKELGVPTND